MNKIATIINEEILKLNEYLTNEGISLMKYFSMSDEEKIESLPYMYSSEWFFDQFIEETDIEYNRNNYVDNDGNEIESDEDFYVENLPYDIQKQYGKWLFNSVNNHQLDVPDAEYPAWSFLAYPELVKNQWLIHFTDDANGIANDGFKYGVDEMDKLGLTTHLSDFEKKYGGYNFSYLLSDYQKYGRSNRMREWKYGNEAVIFRASGVKLWHHGDEEPQVIFYGNTATNIIPITGGENLKHGVYSSKNRDLLYESDDMYKIVDWIVKNYDQYRKHLWNR